jgi:cell division GTPase FtsZ
MVVGMSWDEGLIVSHFIASLLKEEGLHLFAFVTSPFKFEGRSRVNPARLIINDLYPLVDSLIWIDLESTKIGHEESTKGIQASIDHKDSMMVSTIRELSDTINPLQINLSIPYGSLSENGNICIPVVEDLRNGKYKKAIENAFKRLLIGTNGMPLPRVLVINILCSGEPQLKLDDLNTISATIDSFLPSKTRLEFHLCPINSSSRVFELVMFGCGYTQNDLLIINEEIWKPTEEDIRREKFRQRYKALRLKKAYEESKEIAPYNNNASCPRCHTTSTELEWEEFYWFDSDDKLLIEFIYGMCPKCHRRVFSDIILHDNEDDKE